MRERWKYSLESEHKELAMALECAAANLMGAQREIGDYAEDLRNHLHPANPKHLLAALRRLNRGMDSLREQLWAIKTTEE